MPYLMGSIYIAKVGLEKLNEHVNEDILRDDSISPALRNASDLFFVIDGQQRITTFYLFLNESYEL